MNKQELIKGIMKMFGTKERHNLVKTLEKLNYDLEHKYKEFDIIVNYEENDSHLDFGVAIDLLDGLEVKHTFKDTSKNYVLEYKIYEKELVKLKKNILTAMYNILKNKEGK